MADITFDNNGGAGDSKWSTAANWIGGVKPGAGDKAILAADCTCDSDETGAVIAGIDANADVTLTMATGGAVHTQDAACTFNATAVLAFDGGTITHEVTGGAAINFDVYAVTATENGGTFELKSTNAEKASVRLFGSVTGNTASRLLFDGSIGARYGLVTPVAGNTYTACQFKDATVCRGSYANNILFSNCLFYLHPSLALKLYYSEIAFRDCYFYSNYVALAISACRILLVDCTFGKDTDGGAAANSNSDFRSSRHNAIRSYNSLFASTTTLDLQSGTFDMVSTKHNNTADEFKVWQGVGHTVESNAGGGIGGNNAIIVAASASAADTDYARLRYLLATIPAAHGDTIDVTVNLGYAAGNECTLRIDPEGLYGTTQSAAVTTAGDWEAEAIPQYTVNTSAGKKHAVPVYIDIVDSEDIIYIDSVEAVVSGTTVETSFNHIYDGVPANDAGGMLTHGGMTGGMRG